MSLSSSLKCHATIRERRRLQWYHLPPPGPGPDPPPGPGSLRVWDRVRSGFQPGHRRVVDPPNIRERTGTPAAPSTPWGLTPVDPTNPAAAPRQHPPREPTPTLWESPTPGGRRSARRPAPRSALPQRSPGVRSASPDVVDQGSPREQCYPGQPHPPCQATAESEVVGRSRSRP